jgi:hypothetical protein
MKAGDRHTIEVTSEQLGYLAMCARQILKKDRKGAVKFGDALRPDSSLAHRIRVGGDVEDVMLDALDAADEKGHENDG